MALYVNHKNVVSYGFVENDEIKLLKTDKSSEKITNFYTLKCFALESSEKSKVQQPKPVKEYCLVSAAVSQDFKYVSATDSNNFLHLWKWVVDSWTHTLPRTIVRKSQKLIFSNKGSEIILADRSGDVYSFSVADDKEKGVFLLGHISLIIDIAFSSDDRYLLTSDRDGKVRISHYPNCYNILSYCLGHQEFVSTVQCIEIADKELIITSSGDGTIKVWDFDGSIIHNVNLYENECLESNLAKYSLQKNTEQNGDFHSSLPYLLNEKQVRFAVKHVNYCAKSKLCAILFCSIKGVVIYHISGDQDGNFKFVQFIPLESIPFHVLFDDDGNLVVLNKSNENQFLCFKLELLHEMCLKQVDKDCIALAGLIKQLCGDISNIKEFEEDFETFFKRHYDDKEETESEGVTSKKTKSC